MTKGADARCSLTSAPWILAATIIGSAMAFIDGTVVNVALPQIQARLNATDYAPRRLRPESLQQALFPYHEAWG